MSRKTALTLPNFTITYLNLYFLQCQTLFQYKNHTHWTMHSILSKTAQQPHLPTLHFSYTKDDLRAFAEDTSPEILPGILFLITAA